jgi:hypothetical protein
MDIRWLEVEAKDSVKPGIRAYVVDAAKNAAVMVLVVGMAISLWFAFLMSPIGQVLVDHARRTHDDTIPYLGDRLTQIVGVIFVLLAATHYRRLARGRKTARAALPAPSGAAFLAQVDRLLRERGYQPLEASENTVRLGPRRGHPSTVVTATAHADGGGTITGPRAVVEALARRAQGAKVRTWRRPWIQALVGIAVVSVAAGYALYRRQQLTATDDRGYEAAVAIRERTKADVRARTETYQAQVAGIDPAHLLDPTALTSKASIAEHRRRLKTLVEATAALRDDVMALVQRSRAEYEALPIIPRHKEELLRSVDERAARDRADLDALCAVERDLGQAADDILAFLEPRVTTLRVQGADLVFRSGADAREYNRLLGRLRTIARREHDVVEAMRGNRDARG